MTTIVYKHPFLVADQKLTLDNLRYGTCEKVRKFTTRHGEVYAAYCGDGGFDGLLDVLVSAHIEGDANSIGEAVTNIKKFTTGETKISGLVLLATKDGKYKLFNLEPELLLTEFSSEYATDGSGGNIALGALSMGASVWKALDIAAKHDNYTGYPFSGYNIETGEYIIHTHYKDTF